MKVGVTIEARMAATRLPGKVLKPLAGAAALARLIERVRRAKSVDEIVVATTDRSGDEAIAALAADQGVGCFRGSEDDVMGRVLGAAEAYGINVIVELTGDNPLIDPNLIDLVVSEFKASGADYAANMLERTFPLGMDIQVFPTSVLADAASRTNDPAHREHVSLYIYRSPERYRLHNVAAAPAYRRPDLRLTLDTEADYLVISEIYDALYPSNPEFGLDAIIGFLDARPDVARMNADIAHRWA
jgi:spore coat polysaccharide biosynthesis protein SpsF